MCYLVNFIYKPLRAKIIMITTNGNSFELECLKYLKHSRKFIISFYF